MAYPVSLDSFVTLIDNTDDVLAAHSNERGSSIVAVQTKVGIDNSAVATSLDYFLKHASGAYRTHTHDGTSDDGANVPLANTTGTLPINRGGTGATTRPYVDLTTSETIAGVKTFSSIPIGPASNPTSDNELARKAYVDSLGGIVGSYKNLKVTRPTADTLAVTIDEIVLEDSSNNKKTFRSISETANKTVSGPTANGRDQSGAFSNSTWAYLYIIGKTDGTIDSLLSASSSAPTLPSGYVYKALVSAGYIDGSGNFRTFIQEGTWYNYLRTSPIMASGATSGDSSLTSVDTTAFVPSVLSTMAFGSITGNATVTVTNSSSTSLSSTNDSPKFADRDTQTTWIFWMLQIQTANTLWWTSGNSSDTLYIHGFVINKL
jgi:hypothetical protein